MENYKLVLHVHRLADMEMSESSLIP